MTRTRSLAIALLAMAIGGICFLLSDGRERRTPSPSPLDQPPVESSNDDESNESASHSAIVTRAFRGASGSAIEEFEGNPDSDIFGVVLSQEREPVAGATVECVKYPWGRLRSLNFDTALRGVTTGKTTTDAEGRFLLPHARGVIVHLNVSAPGYARASVPGVLAGQRVIVLLSAAAMLDVQVRNAYDEPVGKAAISLWRCEAGTRAVRYFDRREQQTDESGLAVFDDLASGTVWVSVQHAAHGASKSEPVQLSVEDRNLHTVVLPHGHTLRGRVLDRLTRVPIPGARVGEGWHMARVIETDREGRFQLEGWTGATTPYLCAQALHHAMLGIVVQDASSEITFELERGDVVGGRVVSAEGQPIDGAHVSIVGSTWLMGVLQFDSHSVLTDADGLFELSPIRRDMGHTLIVQAEGHGRHLLDFDPPSGPTKRVDLGDVQLLPARTIAGKVMDEKGNPIGGVPVTLSGFNESRFRLKRESESSPIGYGTKEGMRTDDRGRFHFSDLSPGNYTIEAGLVDSTHLMRINVRLEEADEFVPIEIPNPATFTIRFRASKGPIVALPVLVSDDLGSTSVLHNTSGEGEIKLNGLKRGSSIRVNPIVAGLSYLPLVEDRIVLDESLKVVELESCPITRGVVVDESGETLPDHYIYYSIDGHPRQGMFTDDDGSFALPIPHQVVVDFHVPGTVRSGSANERHAGLLRNVATPASGIVVQTSTEHLNESLMAMVSDNHGMAISGAIVIVRDKTFRWSHTTDANGVASFDRLPSRELVVVATPNPPRDLVRSTEVKVVPRGQHVALSLRPVGLVRGVLFDEDDLPVPHMQIHGRSPGESHAVQSDVSGRFLIRVPQGSSVELSAEVRDAQGKTTHKAVWRGSTGHEEIVLRLKQVE